VQFVAGWKKGVSAFKCVPGVIREKRGAWKGKQEVKEQEKALSKRKKLEEKMKKVEKDGEGEVLVAGGNAAPAA